MTQRRRKLTLRKTGLMIAIGLLLIGAIAIAIIVAGTPAPAPQGPPRAANSGSTLSPPVVDVTAEGLRNAGRARFQFVDKNDPGKPVGLLEWASLEPLGAGRSAVAQPRATIFLKDGRIIFIRADKGEVFQAAKAQQPESGSFDGGVPISLFAPKADGSIDTEHDEPIARMFTSRLEFNIAVGELVVPGAFRISSTALEMLGRGLRILGNQPKDRLDLLEVEQCRYVKYDPGADKGRPAPAAPPREVAAAPADKGGDKKSTGPTADAAGKEDFYHAVIGQDVRVTRAKGSLESDRLELFAHLINNALVKIADEPPAKHADAPSPSSRQPRGLASAGAPRIVSTLWRGNEADANAQAIPGEPPTLKKPAGPEEITIVWSGPLRMTPIETRPPELGDDSLVLHCTSPTSGIVKVRDDQTRARADCAELDYGIGHHRLALRGDGRQHVALELAGRGKMATNSIALNLATGIGSSSGPGTLTSDGDPNSPVRRIEWSDNAGLRLATRDGWVIGELHEAMFAGSVKAHDAQASLAAGMVHAFLTEGPDGAAVLSRIVAEDDVFADAGDRGTLKTQWIDVGFEPNAVGKAEVSKAVAKGGVVATRAEWTVESPSLEVAMGHDEHGASVIENVHAVEGLVFTGRGLRATADRCDADVKHQLVNLIGEGTTLSKDGSVVKGKQVQLDGVKRELYIHGPGSFDFDSSEAPRPGHEPQRGEVAWTKWMRFDDAKGTAECHGDAVATTHPAPGETAVLNADSILLVFTPDPGKSFASIAPTPSSEKAPESAKVNRQLLRAEAIGASEEREGGRPATIESKRFSTADPAAVERVLYVESGRIIDDEAAGLITLPGAGKLLIDDRRVDANAPTPKPGAGGDNNGGGLIALGGQRGTTLFTWAGDLKFQRASGVLTINREVRVLHRAGADQNVTAMDCDRLTALIRTSTPSTANSQAPLPGQQAELISATADGSVRVQSTDKSLTADKLTYDAVRSTAEAIASPDGRVVLFDPTQPQPVQASKLFWDLRRNVVRVIEPVTVTIPR